MESSDYMVELEVLACHEDEIISILKRHDAVSVCEKLSENIVISKETQVKFRALDHGRLHTELLVRYLLYQVYESVREDKLVYYSVLDVLCELGGESIKNKIRRELHQYQLKELLNMMVQSSPSDTNTGVSRKRARADLLEDYCLCEYDATILTDVLAKVAFKWKELAISLKLDRNQIEECQTKSSFKIKLYEVISKFIQNGGNFCSLNKLEEALKSDIVELPVEGSSLKDNFIAKITSSCFKKRTCPSHEFQGYNSGNVIVDNGKAALLGFQVTTITQGSYQWFLKGKPLSNSEVYAGTSRPFLFISQVNWKTVGEYECQETSTNKYSKMTLATYVSAITQKFFSIYRNWPDIPKDIWPPVRNTEYVNLALISKDQKTNNDFVYTLQDNMDDIDALKSSINYEEVFGQYESGALVVVEGRPGSGKTTLMHKVTKDWAKRGNVLVNAEVVVLVSLRLLNAIKTEHLSLQSIFKNYVENDEERSAFVDSIKKKNGKGLCIIIDGLDEYDDVSLSNNVIFDLIYKRILPLSMIIVASRPVGTATIRLKAPVTQRIEVLGFTKEQIEGYVNCYFRESGAANVKLWKYLNLRANVLRMCYLPVHAAMVCFMYEKKGEEIPHTETKIYEKFTILTLLRKTHSSVRISSLNDLKGSMKEYFKKICKLALDMTFRKQQVVNESQTNFPLSPPNSDKGSLGLVTIDSTASLFGMEDLYTFFHLTFQEYLAAFYLTTIREEHLVIEEAKKSHGNLQMVWKFYCGIVQFRDDSIVLNNIMSDPNTDVLYKAQCAFESQQQCPCDMLLEKTDTNVLSFKDRNFLPTDYLAISYVITSTRHKVTSLLFTECTIDKEGVAFFLGKLQEVHLSNITHLGYQKKKCTIPEFKSLHLLLDQLQSIEVLDLDTTPIGKEGIKYLTRYESTFLPNLNTIKIALPLKSGSEKYILEHLSFNSPKLNIVHYNVTKKSYVLDELILLEAFNGKILCSSNLQSLTYCNGSFLTLYQNGTHLIQRCLLTLALINCTITDEDVSDLVNLLAICINLTTLQLDFNKITDKGAKTLSDSLIKLHELTTLSAHCNEIGDTGASCLLSSVAELKKIQCLELQCNPISEAGIYLLSNMLKDKVHAFQLYVTSNPHQSALKSDIQLVQKSVDWICANPKDNEIISKALDCSKNCPEIHINGSRNDFLCFTNVNVSKQLDDAKLLFDAIKSCNQLRTLRLRKSLEHVEDVVDCLKFINLLTLDLGFNNISSMGAVALANGLKFCTELETLELANNSICSEGAVALAYSLKLCAKLQKLNLKYNRIGSEGAVALADGLKFCTELQTLELVNNNICSDGAVAVADGLKFCTKLQTLELGYNSIGSVGAVALADSLKSKSYTKLHTLHLNSNIIDSEGAVALVCALKFCSKLQKLNLNCNSICTKGAVALADNLKFCTELQTLELGINGIGSEGAVVLADGLKFCSKLQHLYLKSNNIGSEGAVALADNLKFCTELQTLELGNNGVGSEGAVALSDCLKLKSCNLRTLHLYSNGIGSDGAVALASGLKFCTELQTLTLKNCSIGTQGAAALNDGLKSCTKLKMVDLRSNNISSGSAAARALQVKSYIRI